MIEFQVTHELSVGSTNDLAREFCLADGGNHLVIAQQQTKGRGRLGRSWRSEQGNLYLSMAWPCQQQDLAGVAFFSIKAAVCLQEALSAQIKQEIRLKWPNDALLNNQKICGILLEYTKPVLVLGMGINVVDAPQGAASLVQVAPEITAQKVEQELVPRLIAALNSPLENEVWAQKWNQSCNHMHKEIFMYQGAKVTKGIFQGIDASGAALNRQENSEIARINSGEAFFAPKNRAATTNKPAH